MGFDQLSPVAPARVRCLLLPCGKIKLAGFSEAVRRLQKETLIRLSDVSPEHGSKRAMFSPATYPMGAVLLEFSTSDAPESSRRLAPFELYRRPLIVLGIADASQSTRQKIADHKQNELPEDPDLLSSLLAQLKETHDSALVHKILIFNGEGDQKKSSPGVLHIPAQHKSSSTALKTIVCDIIADFLEELSFYARSVQALPNIETPTSFSLPTLSDSRPNSAGQGASSRPDSGASSPMTNSKDGIRSPYRASMPAHILSPLSAEMSNGSTSSLSSSPQDGVRPATTFDDISTERPSSSSSNKHNRQVSVQGFGSGTTSEKARNQAKGRIGIVVGSMYLLAGRWSEAIKELAESAITAKWSNDHAWFAKALDNILVSLLMCGWAGIEAEIPQICYPGEKPPWSFRSTKAIEGNRIAAARVLGQLLPDLSNQILHYYSRAVTSSYTEKAAVPILTFSESALRFARLLSILHFNYGVLNERTFTKIITNSILAEGPIPGAIDSLTTKAEIAAITLKAVPPHGGDEVLDPLDRLNILAGVASILSSLGYQRKKGFILRDLITILLPLLIQNRKDSAAELGYHPAASLSSAELATESLNASTIAQNLASDETGIVSFLDSVCETYGVVSSKGNKTSLTSEVSHESTYWNAYLDRILLQSKQRSYGNSVLKMDVLRWCINVCEALPDLEGMIRFSSDLLTTASTGLAPGPDSSDAYPRMSMEDQVRSFSTIVRAAGASTQLGNDQEAEYWDEFLIRDVEIMTTTNANPPIPRRKHELMAVANPDNEKKAGPFIYNPFASKPPVNLMEPTLLLDRDATFVVLLQNLFDMELDVEWIKLETNTDSIVAMARDLIVGPYRTQKIHLKGQPKALGATKILGCTAKIRGCKAKSFPIFKSPWRPVDETRLKTIGIQASLQQEDQQRLEDTSKGLSTDQHRPQAVTFPVTVIEDQPLLLLKSTTLTQSAIMVLVGQTRTFDITLENTSQKEVDFMLVSFTDSTSELLRSAVDNKDTIPSQIYEAEYSAYHRPALRLVKPDLADLKIGPRGRLVLTIEVYGKPGLHSGSVQITYSHLGVPRDELGEKFHIRQITVPVIVTVNASVDLIRTEILPYNNVIAGSRLSQSQPNTPAIVFGTGEPSKRRLDDVLDELKRQHLGENRCFLLLDFFNAWPRPLKVSLEANESGDPDNWNTAYEVEDILQPGNSARLLMIIPKVSLKDDHASIPIINPSNRRQFVLNSNKVSADFERTDRELFWYKEDILKNLRATWSELTGQSGEISLRTMRISPRMIDLLKPDIIDMDIVMKGSADNVHEFSSSHYSIHTDAFITISVRIRNQGSKPIHPILRLQPSLRHQAYNIALDLSRKLAFNGLLQRVIPVLNPDDTFEADLGIVFLCAGEYEIGASLEEIRTVRDATETTQVDASEERRIWHAKRPCLVDVVSHA